MDRNGERGGGGSDIHNFLCDKNEFLTKLEVVSPIISQTEKKGCNLYHNLILPALNTISINASKVPILRMETTKLSLVLVVVRLFPVTCKPLGPIGHKKKKMEEN